ncbi:MAG: hypothetical protein CV089_02210 [Nitrospira sp. WS110]|nr:hypothetical protein [Nitrospira sp. WS110]
MAFSEVSGRKATSSAGGTSYLDIAFAGSVTSGNLLSCVTGAWDPGTFTITSNRSNAFTSYTKACLSGSVQVCNAYALATSSGSCTVRVDTSKTFYGSVSVDEFQADATIEFDVDGGGNAGNSTTASDALTTTGSAGLLIGGVSGGESYYPNAWTITPEATYTQFGELESALNAPHNAIYKVVSSGSHTPQWTVATGHWAAYALAFKEAASGTTYQRTVAATCPGTGGLARVRTAFRLFAAEPYPLGTMTRVSTRYRTLAGLTPGVGVASRKAEYPRTLAGSSPGVAVMSKVKTAVLALAGSSPGVGTVSRVRTALRTLQGASPGVGTMSRVASFPRLLGAVTPVSGVVSRVRTGYRNLDAVSPVSATLSYGRMFLKTLAGVAQGVAGLASMTVAGVTLDAVTQGLTTLSRIASYPRSLAGVVEGAPTLTRVRTAIRALQATSSTVADVLARATLYVLLTASTTGQALLTPVYRWAVSLAGTVHAVATEVHQFIEGNGELPPLIRRVFGGVVRWFRNQ